ncbi:MAG: HSP20 family [Geobacteraceae bacterium]|nr:MAG: HSP20 family [Geobacteraceae bacterium]
MIPKDPLEWLALFRQQINEIFNYLSSLDGKTNLGEHEYIPLLDVYETADKFIVEVELPGFETSSLALSICCNTLVVEGMKREASGNRKGSYICLERHFGRFCRTVEIPPTADVEGVTAKYEKGVLSVAFPRLKDKKVIIRDIPIEQGDGNGK